jgi:7-keto-8-aminopelargonate synthetase-like enzyme
MPSSDHALDVLDRMLGESAELGLLQCSAEDRSFDGRTIRIQGKNLLQLGSCSYLGLELDRRLIQAGQDALERYGAHFSSSRAYVSAPLYTEIETLLEQIFETPALVMPTTTLGHLAALPVLCGSRDALVLDQQAHHSLHMAANQLRAQGAPVRIVRHNRLDQLEEILHETSRSHEKIWYAADGVYSMYGDLAPMGQLRQLLEQYPSLHVYVDDAHGMSWYGQRGCGYALSAGKQHDRMVIATTLGKSFGAGGAVVLARNEDWRRRIRNCGGPLTFAGPVPPPVLGSAIASAKIHLSGEIHQLQDALQGRIHHCNKALRAAGLSILGDDRVPIRFICIGAPAAARRVVSRTIRDGFFTNISHFPAVPMNRAGIRFTITLHTSISDIERAVDAIAKNIAAVANERSPKWKTITRSHEEPIAPAARVSSRAPKAAPSTRAEKPAVMLEEAVSIEAIDPQAWNQCLGSRGTFDVAGLRFLEALFHQHQSRSNRWAFRYFVVRDRDGSIVLATFFTESLWKEDMLAPVEVSQEAELRRQSDPYHLTATVFSMGSLLTEGNHLYLDRTRDWRRAVRTLLASVRFRARECGAKMIVLRDLPGNESDLSSLLEDEKFERLPMPDRMVLEMNFHNEEQYMESLSPKSRYHQRRQVLPWTKMYDVEVIQSGQRNLTSDELAHFHSLYLNVKNSSLEINTFELPKDIFAEMLRHPGWELVVLRGRPELDPSVSGQALAVGACFIGAGGYSPMVLGLDYRFVRTHGLYRQCLYQAIQRARVHGSRRVFFGMGAPLEKRRFGAMPEASAIFLQPVA